MDGRGQLLFSKSESTEWHPDHVTGLPNVFQLMYTTANALLPSLTRPNTYLCLTAAEPPHALVPEHTEQQQFILYSAEHKSMLICCQIAK